MGKLVPSPTVTSKVAAVLQQGADLGFYRPALFVDGAERAGQGGDHDVERAGSRDDDGLFVERVEHIVDQPFRHAQGLRADHLDQPAASGLSQRGRRS